MVKKKGPRFTQNEGYVGTRTVNVEVPVDDNDVKGRRGRDGGEHNSRRASGDVAWGRNRFCCYLDRSEGLLVP